MQPKNTDGLTIAQRKEIAEIEKRRAPLQAQQSTTRDTDAPDKAPNEAPDSPGAQQ